MKKVFLPLLLLVSVLFSSCAQHTAKSGSSSESLNVPNIKVTSASVNKDGKLLTQTAAANAKGSNKSPQVSWDAVSGAACYAVCMFDTDANWLHWFVAGIQKNSLELGEYTKKDQYVGPYPPSGTGAHHYKIEVFALKQAPGSKIGNMDSANSYGDIIKKLDTAGGAPGNILARGSVVGTYANGDNTTE